MSKEIEVKQHILKMIEDLMMGNSGSKFKPKVISVEMDTKPEDAEESDLEEDPRDMMADKMNAEDAGESVDEWEGSPEDEEADDELERKPKMGLKEFLASQRH